MLLPNGKQDCPEFPYMVHSLVSTTCMCFSESYMQSNWLFEKTHDHIAICGVILRNCGEVLVSDKLFAKIQHLISYASAIFGNV